MNKCLKKYYFVFLLWLCALFFTASFCFAAESSPIPAELQHSTQLLLVLSPTWASFQGTLQYYQRNAPGQAWQLVNRKPIRVVVGKNGMAWGVELTQRYLFLPQAKRIKQEGDSRSPAGFYELGTAFGFAPDNHLIPHMQWPYLPLKPTSICVDDETSKYYNQLVDRANVIDWKPGTSGEPMLKIVPQYTWGVLINYNKSHVVDKGSCIFMHVWRNSMQGTAGCVAMAQKKMVKILGWLDPAKKPVIVLLPQPVYKDLRHQWGLPS